MNPPAKPRPNRMVHFPPRGTPIPFWGEPPLTAAQWVAFRDWQKRTIRKWTYEPAAIARRKELLGTEPMGTPQTFPPAWDGEPGAVAA